jgi:hypothetical protein
VADGFNWANILAASAKDNASVRNNYGLFFALFFLGGKGFHVAEVYAFSAGMQVC